ncbi:MAG TPA: TadE/TadG family type IV pilus assembly protein [Mycobacterium sp.]|nr:TadE/TadG family type IV pilus assembly protein [Mycobacterium sp.]
MATRNHFTSRLARLRRTLHPEQRVGPARRSARGQSLVEFALVLPMLLVLLLGVADFGRVFAAGITLESAARNGAEAAAQEYLQIQRNKTLETADYTKLHDVAREAVCRDTEILPNATGGGSCSSPVVAVCVHDAAAGDAGCGTETPSAPAECDAMDGGWNAALSGTATSPLPYVEVRVCYRFTTLFNLQQLELPFGWGLSVGDVWLQRTRVFSVGAY